MQIVMDLGSNEVQVVDPDTGREARVSYDEWHACVEQVRDDPVWRSDISRLFDNRVGKLMLDTIEYGAQQALRATADQQPMAVAGN